MAGEWIGQVTYHFNDETRLFHAGVSQGCLQGLCAGVLVARVVTPKLLLQLGTCLRQTTSEGTVHVRNLTETLGSLLIRLPDACAKLLLLRLYHVLLAKCANEAVLEYASMLLPLLNRLGPMYLGELLRGPVYFGLLDKQRARIVQPPLVYVRAEMSIYLSRSVPVETVLDAWNLPELYLTLLLSQLWGTPYPHVREYWRRQVMTRAMKDYSSTKDMTTRRTFNQGLKSYPRSRALRLTKAAWNVLRHLHDEEQG